MISMSMVRIKYVTIILSILILQSCSLTLQTIKNDGTHDNVYDSVVYVSTDFIDEDDDLATAAASGVIVKVNDSTKKSYVLTVKHFCDILIEGSNKSVGKSDYKVFRLLKKNNDSVIEYAGNLFYLDRDYDLCLIEVDNTEKLVAINISKDDVELGDVVSVIGAHGRIFPAKYDGYVIADFSDNGNKCVECTTVSVPSVHGSSGSPVYNSDGKLVGIILGMVRGDHNLSIMQNLSSIKLAIQKSRI